MQQCNKQPALPDSRNPAVTLRLQVWRSGLVVRRASLTSLASRVAAASRATKVMHSLPSGSCVSDLRVLLVALEKCWLPGTKKAVPGIVHGTEGLQLCRCDAMKDQWFK